MLPIVVQPYKNPIREIKPKERLNLKTFRKQLEVRLL